jgi:hypothetical protein
MLPFTRVQFFDTFRDYNAMFGFAAIAGYLLAALTVVAILCLWRRRDNLALAVLAVFWGWTGIFYHLLYFTRINKAAWLFGALFLIEAIMLALAASRRSHEPPAQLADFRHAAGWALLVYATIVYPIIGLLSGHAFADLPQFGIAPCPVTVFTFGIMLLLRRPPAWSLTLIPFMWSIIGGSAAFLLSIPQDWPLLAGGLLTLGLLYAIPRGRNGISETDS